MIRWVLAASLACVSVAAARADDIVFGVVTPIGTDAKAAIETALEVINGKHEELPILFGQGGGLDRLNGAKLRVVYGDGGDDPAQTRAEAERLAGPEHAVALIGGGTDETAAAIDAVAEHRQLPFLSPLRNPKHAHDLSWIFRLGPTPDITADAVFGFLGDRAKAVALVWDDTPAGRESAEASRKTAQAAGVAIVADLKLPPAATSLTAEALVIAGVKPDAVIPAVAREHAVLLLDGLAAQRFAPIVIAPGGGCLDPAFLAAAGSRAERMFCTSGFAAAPPGLRAIDTAFRARAGRALDESAARVVMATLLLADVINRAGTTKAVELRAALMDTNTPGDQILLSWQGIRFDDAARNVLATPAIQQVQGGAFRIVGPESIANAQPVWK